MKRYTMPVLVDTVVTRRRVAGHVSAALKVGRAVPCPPFGSGGQGTARPTLNAALFPREPARVVGHVRVPADEGEASTGTGTCPTTLQWRRLQGEFVRRPNGYG